MAKYTVSKLFNLSNWSRDLDAAQGLNYVWENDNAGRFCRLIYTGLMSPELSCRDAARSSENIAIFFFPLQLFLMYCT